MEDIFVCHVGDEYVGLVTRIDVDFRKVVVKKEVVVLGPHLLSVIDPVFFDQLFRVF